MGKGSFAFAFFMDRQVEERKRGVTIACTTKEFNTEKYHYSIIDAPGHKDFIKNMITGAALADVAVIMLPADGFIEATRKADLKKGLYQGQTRQHARLINLLGVNQVMVGINKMDCEIAGYGKEKYEEVAAEVRSMLGKVGFKPDFVTKSIPIIPISGLKGDNLIEKSTNMPWWTGMDVATVRGDTVHVHTMLDVFNDMCAVPVRDSEKPMRCPISAVMKLPGVGSILTGRVEQGVVRLNEIIVFLPTHTDSNKCEGKAFTIEMHHKKQNEANPGDNVGMNIKNVWKTKNESAHAGDIMIYAKDTSLKAAKEFTANVQVLDIPGEISKGYTPLCLVRCAKAPCKITELVWKMGKDTGKAKADAPHSLKSGDMAQIKIVPQKPFVVDTYTSCAGLGRIAFLDGNGAVMLGKVTAVEF